MGVWQGVVSEECARYGYQLVTCPEAGGGVCAIVSSEVEVVDAWHELLYDPSEKAGEKKAWRAAQMIRIRVAGREYLWANYHCHSGVGTHQAKNELASTHTHTHTWDGICSGVHAAAGASEAEVGVF